MRWSAERFFAAFFTESLASVTFMTAAGLVGTLVYASSGPSFGAIALCTLIALVAIVTICLQVRQAYIRSGEEDELYRRNRARFDGFAEAEKTSLERIVNEWSVAQDELPNHSKLLDTGFVFRDGTAGRFFLNPGCQRLVARLVKEWRTTKRPATP